MLVYRGDVVLIVCSLINRMLSYSIHNNTPHSILFPNEPIISCVSLCLLGIMFCSWHVPSGTTSLQEFSYPEEDIVVILQNLKSTTCHFHPFLRDSFLLFFTPRCQICATSLHFPFVEPFLFSLMTIQIKSLLKLPLLQVYQNHHHLMESLLAQNNIGLIPHYLVSPLHVLNHYLLVAQLLIMKILVGM